MSEEKKPGRKAKPGAKKPGPQPDPNSKRSQGVPRHVSPRLVFHVSQEALERLTRHMENSKPKRKASDILRHALDMYLDSVGEPAASGVTEDESKGS